MVNQHALPIVSELYGKYIFSRFVYEEAFWEISHGAHMDVFIDYEFKKAMRLHRRDVQGIRGRFKSKMVNLGV